MESKLLKVLAQRLLDLEGDNFEVSFYMLTALEGIDAQLLEDIYASFWVSIPGAGSLRDVANLRAVELGFKNIDDLITDATTVRDVFEG
jgi:hypothetical protein